MANANVLSDRYATQPINDIWSDEGKVLSMRKLWIAVMKAQLELGLDIPAEEIAKYERAKVDIDLGRIREIERKTRHDVKANIEAFVQAAGAEEHVHKGMNSRDATDNVEQMQIRDSARFILGKYSSVLRHMMKKAVEYSGIILTARTHHQPAQPTLLGRRFAMWGEELLHQLKAFERIIQEYPLRGIKGPVGTQFDMLTLLGSTDKVVKLERMVAEELGFNRVLEAPGQVYSRSLDYQIVSQLALISSGVENFAKGMRLMSGYELATEGFKKGQVGSSAMPHKMNTRSSERICAFAELLKMYADGASRLSGDQWEEGDVSCSAIRRVVLPDSFYASDGLCETSLTVMNEMGAYPEMISQELDRYLPFLATTELLMIAVQAGAGREEAHEAIKKCAVGEALRMREEPGYKPDLATNLACSPVFQKYGVSKDDISRILEDKAHFIGNAQAQIRSIAFNAGAFIADYEEDAKYEPGDIL